MMGDDKRRNAATDGSRGGWLRRWYGGKGPVFRFVFGFAVLMTAFSIFFFVYFTNTPSFERYLEINADASAWCLRQLGYEARASGVSVASSRASVQIRHGCDALFPSALFVGAVLASPVRFRAKIPGMLIGTVVLLSINLVRIMSLFWTQIYFPKYFHVMHIDVWQPAFIFLSLFFWILWAIAATRRPVETSDVSA